jgi:NAD(P)H-flavin reductase
MFGRSSAGVSPALHNVFQSSLLRQFQRHHSTGPDQSRKLPNASLSVRFGRYRTLFRIGGFAGGLTIGVLVYSYFSRDTTFVTYTLQAKQPVSSTASIFHLSPKHSSQQYDLYKDVWKKGIWNVQFKQPQIQVLRAYTPLPPIDGHVEEEKGELRFLIRHDPHGEVSTYLHRLSIGAEIEMRGPYLEYELAKDVRQVVFFAGGTGIAPALQVAHALFGNAEAVGIPSAQRQQRLHILWANRTREDCLGGTSDPPPAGTVPPKPTWSGLFTKQKTKPIPPVSAEKGAIVEELEALKQRYPGQVTVEYFVNTEDTWIDEDAVARALSRFDESTPQASQERHQILISGPPGFIAHLAGPKEWRNGREEQGSVGRILARAISKNPHNVKVWKI